MNDMPALANKLGQLATQQWFTETAISGVKLFRSDYGNGRCPTAYDPSIVIIVQGRKIGYLGDKIYHYDANNYLVLSVAIPLECETIATPEEPLLGISINLTPGEITELLLDIDDKPFIQSDTPSAVFSTPVSASLFDATRRLVDCLADPMDTKILGPQIKREILYEVLKGDQGATLKSLTIKQSRLSQIEHVLKIIHAQLDQKLDVKRLASDANMSVSAFHQHFKAVTSSSPLQYIKQTRLHKARSLMLQQGLTASSAALQVGYESASQFSREFKSYFGRTPLSEVQQLKTLLNAETPMQ